MQIYLQYCESFSIYLPKFGILYFFYQNICVFRKIFVPLQSQRLIVKVSTMEQKKFQQYSDAEFKAALLATMNLKHEWMASVDKREKELGLR